MNKCYIDCYYKVGGTCMFHEFSPCEEKMECMEVEPMEVLENGYTVIHKTDEHVLGYKELDEVFQRFMKNKYEYASWQFSTRGGTVFGNYNYDLEEAIETYKKRAGIKECKELKRCIEQHTIEVGKEIR